VVTEVFRMEECKHIKKLRMQALLINGKHIKVNDILVTCCEMNVTAVSQH
jgi:hypothetical protein